MNYIDCRLCCLPSLIIIFEESIKLFSFSEDKASNEHTISIIFFLFPDLLLGAVLLFQL